MSSNVHTPKSFPRWQGEQRRIAITGGIACGKSGIGHYLHEIKKLPILDADFYAHEALQPGQHATKEVIKHYGQTILNPNDSQKSSINRSALRKIIFENNNERLWLEKLIHPLVIQKFQEDLETKKNCKTVVLIIPLLFEANLTNICSEIWVINCKPEQQIERLVKRDRIPIDIATKMIQSQWPLEKKRKLADVIIDNTKGPQEWEQQIESFFRN